MNDNDGRPHNGLRKDCRIGVAGSGWKISGVEVQPSGRRSISAANSLVSSSEDQKLLNSPSSTTRKMLLGESAGGALCLPEVLRHLMGPPQE